jgi:hypothetical protein
MMNSQLSLNWIKMAAVYLAVGVSLGIHMGKSHEFLLAPVHAHINLLGWATMALMGILHHLFASSLVNKIAVVQFWLHQLATPVLLVALALMLKGDADMEPVVGIMSMVVGVSVLLFVYNVLRNLKSSA